MNTSLIILATVKAFVTYGVRRSLSDRKRLVEAADKFRSAFTECKTRLDSSSEDPYRIIEPYLERQKLAVNEFKPFLREAKKRQLQKAWESYYSFPGFEPGAATEKYFAAGSLQKRLNERRKASKRIERMLALAPIY